MRSRGAPGTQDQIKTQELIVRVRSGDESARETLFRRYRDRLAHLVHGHLPHSARSIGDTQDIVQSTLGRALNHLDSYEYQHEGAFLAWLRTIARHLIVDQIRLYRRQWAGVPISDQLESGDPTPLERAISAENMALYERALEEQPERQRHAVIMRLEYGMPYSEVAANLGAASPNAARMMVHRATVEIARRMRELAGEPQSGPAAGPPSRPR
jgi:RNA polymerase sigma-70 factor (ECF subfamily)